MATRGNVNMGLESISQVCEVVGTGDRECLSWLGTTGNNFGINYK